MKITRDEFNQLFNQLRDNFKGLESLSRLQRCYNYISDLPVAAVREIVEDLIDSERTAPLPKDFEKRASAYKKKFYFKNGYYFGEENSESKSEDKLDCEMCMDTGITKIIHHKPDDFKQLMRCDCQKGSDSSDELPQWSNELSGAFLREKMTTEWFNPELICLEEIGLQNNKINKRMHEWKKIKQKSEKYWREIGFKK